MISNKPKPTLKQKRNALIWTGLVTDAVSRAKTSTKIVVIGVAKLKTAYMLQDTLTIMAMSYDGSHTFGWIEISKSKWVA